MSLVLAAALLMQDQTAEEAFKKIEAVLDSAKTISIKYTHRSTLSTNGKVDLTNETKGELLLKGDRKAFIAETYSMEQLGVTTKTGSIIVSDGVRMMGSSIGSGKTAYAETPQNLNAVLRTTLMRIRLQIVPLNISGVFDDPDYQKGNPKVDYPIPVCESDEEDGGKRLLKYSYKIERVPPQTAHVKLWYDPTSRVILRRDFEQPEGSSIRVIEETFSEFTLNADIPDAKFKIPEEKK